MSDIQKLVAKVKDIYIAKPEDYSGRELFCTIQDLKHAVDALAALAIAQQAQIEQLQKDAKRAH